MNESRDLRGTEIRSLPSHPRRHARDKSFLIKNGGLNRFDVFGQAVSPLAVQS
jgi:hypothetical protein